MNRSCASSRLRAEVDLDGQRRVLRVVVGEHGGGDVVGHLAEQRWPGRSASSSPASTTRFSAILMLTSWSEVSTPGGVVDGVGVHPPAGQRVLDPAALGQPEVAALADHPDPQLPAVHPHGVVGLVPHVERALGRRPSRRCRCRR